MTPDRPLPNPAGSAGTDSPRVDAAERHGAPAQPPCLDSDTLLRGHTSVSIAHNGTLYRLQATRQGKLILTK